MAAAMRPGQPVRSMLFTPGDRPERVAKALAAADADILVVDWEDAVAPGQKDAARAATIDAWDAWPTSRTLRVIRVNDASTPWHDADVEAAVRLRPDAILLPKADTAAGVAAVAEFIGDLEAEHHIPADSIRLFLLIESPRGVLDAEAIARASDRVVGLVWGADDYQVALGGRRRRDNMDVLHARSRIAMVASAVGVPAIDQVCTELDDMTDVLVDANFAADLGYEGKIVIHPRQVPVVNGVFAPTPGQIVWARGLLEAADEADREGKGAFTYEGRMVDRPIIRQARRILDLAGMTGHP